MATATLAAADARSPKKPSSWLVWNLLRIWSPLILAIGIAAWLIRHLKVKDYWFINLPLVKQSAFSMDSVLYIFLLATILLVFFGTIEFFAGILDALKGEWRTRLAFWLTVASFVPAVLWAIPLFTTDARTWPLVGYGIGHGIEYISGTIFILFTAIDGLFCLSFKQSLKSVANPQSGNSEPSTASDFQKRNLELKYQFSRQSLLFIDFPVLFGLVVVYALSWYFINTPELHALTEEGRNCFGGDFEQATRCFGIGTSERAKVFESFMHGFSTGAIAMHLAFSQIIFGILKSRDIHQRYKEELTKDRYA